MGYIIQSIAGLEFPDIRQTRYGRPGESGAIVSNVLYEGRMITLTGMVFGETAILFQQRRRALQNAISLSKDVYSAPVPLSLKLTTFDDLLIQIDCFVEQFVMKNEQMNGQEFLLQLYAPEVLADRPVQLKLA